MNSTDYDVIVIGGGASGMMSAITAARSGAEVLLIEKNDRLGEKLRITGGGRCNIINAEDDTRLLLANFGPSSKFLFSAFSQFGVQDTISFFESIGLKIKVEANKRAFPVSEKAEDVVRCLENELSRLNVTIITGTAVQSIYAPNNNIEYIKIKNKRLRAKSYILATGGTSRPETGSTGDGFKWLKTLGHDIKNPTPNITPLAVKESWVKKVSGISLTDIDVVFFSNKVRAFKIHGSVLFTHFGLSGPLIMNNAFKVAELFEQGDVTAHIDCFPKLNEKELDKNILKIIDDNPAKILKNTLKEITQPGFPKALTQMFSEAELNTKNSELGRTMRTRIVKLLKALPLTISHLMGFEKAVVADGGLNLTNIDTRKMQSKKISNLFITGDLININRPSGGYSLQLCWTTGYVAGISSLE